MTRLITCTLVLGTLLTTSCQAKENNPQVVMDTSHGKVTIELFADKAPVSVKNFLDYVDAKHYDGTIFHRVMPNFMIQGGGFEPGMKNERTTHDPIKNESDNGLFNERGTIAMARTSKPNSATAQFYINVKNNADLDRANAQDRVGYAVFGKVIEGMDVVDKIESVDRDASDRPKEDVTIQRVELAKD